MTETARLVLRTRWCGTVPYMTFATFAATVNRRLGRDSRAEAVHAERNSIRATWESGPRLVRIEAVAADLANARFSASADEEAIIRGWRCTSGSAAELAASISAFFDGLGPPQE